VPYDRAPAAVLRLHAWQSPCVGVEGAPKGLRTHVPCLQPPASKPTAYQPMRTCASCLQLSTCDAARPLRPSACDTARRLRPSACDTARPLRPSACDTARPLRPSACDTARPLRPSSCDAAGRPGHAYKGTHVNQGLSRLAGWVSDARLQMLEA